MGRIVGIDLGTTNTVVSVLEGERPRVLADERGHSVIPSVVAWKASDTFLTGHAAANLLITRPDRAVCAVKRLMGRTFDAPDVQDALARGTIEARSAVDGGVEVRVGEAWLTPQKVAAELLKTARSAAERALGTTVEEAVITVPAYFNHAQRRATLEAARLAGLRCERLLNEPTAAALAYGHRRSIDARVVIFDLGGGTFDVSVLRMNDGIYEILATSGDTFLGGEDFDQRIVDHLCASVVEKHGWDPRSDKGALRRVKDAAEQAKRTLSQTDRAEVSVPHLGPKVSLDATLTRSQVEDLTRDLIERCIAVTDEALAMARVPRPAVDDVILVGGMTRWPAVRDAVRAAFGREPNRGVHPDEVVAIGAAVHAGSLEDGQRPRAVLLDVTPFDLGIDTAGGGFAPVIARNSRVPCSETRTFVTTRDDQERVTVTVRQGEGAQASENEFLGEFCFEGLPPLPRMQARVQVNFRVDANGVLHVTASDPSTGESRRITVRNYGDVARGEGHAYVESEATAPANRGSPAAAAVAPATPVPAATGSGVREKVGLLQSLFGSRAGSASPAAVPAAEPVPVSAPERSQDVSDFAVLPVEAIEPEPLAEVLAVERSTAAVESDAAAAPLIDAGEVLTLGDEMVEDTPVADDAGVWSMPASGADLSDLFDGPPAARAAEASADPRVHSRAGTGGASALELEIDLEQGPFALERQDHEDEDEDDAPTSPGVSGDGLTVELPNDAAFFVYLRGLLSQPVMTVSVATPPDVGSACEVSLLAPGQAVVTLSGTVTAHVRGGVRVEVDLDGAARDALEGRLD
jgi:molecular chaperone DnaK